MSKASLSATRSRPSPSEGLGTTAERHSETSLARLRDALEPLCSVEALLAAVGEQLPEVLSVCDRASLAFVDPDREHLRFYRLYPPMTALPSPLRRVRAADTVVGQVALTGRSHAVQDVRSNKHITFGHAAHDGIRSTISVPVFVDGTLVGSLNTGSTQVGGACGAVIRAELEAAAAIIGPAIYRAEARALPDPELNDGGLVGQSPGFRTLTRRARQAAASDATVLLTGETGVGKTALARAIHGWSPRREGPFVAIHLADLPQSLIEAELFGHERGAFTGAGPRRPGRFEAAHRGTILLDEIGEAPMAVQAKLLRILQDRSFERVGGNATVRADVRVIAATNRDLEQAVAAGEFRRDLLYRLNILPLEVPPLRERSEDVAPLVRSVLSELSRRDGREYRLAVSAWRRLEAYGWPGNVRELENVLVRATVHEPAEALTLDGLAASEPARRVTGEVVVEHDWPTRDEHERRYLRRVMTHTRGRIEGPAGAAEILGMRPSTLRSRLKRLGLGIDSFRQEERA